MSLRRNLAGAIAGSIAVLALIVPSSQATIPVGVSNANWNLRHSWVDYLSNPLWGGGAKAGFVTPTGSPAPTPDASGGQTSYTYTPAAPATKYGYIFAKNTDSGSPRTVTLKGGLDFDLAPHGIDVSLSDVAVIVNGTGEQIRLDATFVPVGGGATQVRNDIIAANVSSAGAVTLTTAGAEVFNGGSNGSYSNGSAFGTLAYS